MPWGLQLAMMGSLLLTSKGVAGVPRASFVILTATLAQFHIPEWPTAHILVIAPFCGPALIGAAAFLVGYAVRNRQFFGFLARRLPLPGLVVAVAMHWCYHIYATATFVLVQVMTKLHLRAPSSYMALTVA